MREITDLLNLGDFASSFGLYSPADVTEARQRYGANCGPASFAAVHRMPVVGAMQHFPGFPDRYWTTIGDMRIALRSASTTFEDTKNELPQFGLALIQLKVDDRPLHGLHSLSQTHWVAVCEGTFYDVNWRGWLPIPIWEQVMLPQFSFRGRGAISWHTRNGLSVIDEPLRAKTFQRERKAH
jgi:hypothetical protein